MSDIQEVIQIQVTRTAAHLQPKSRQGRRTPIDHMEVQISLATTGETVFSTTYSEVNDLRVWERLHICHELARTKYFSIASKGISSWTIQPW